MKTINTTWVRYNLKQRKLPVIDKFHFNGGFLFEETVSGNGWQGIGYEIIEWPMSGMFYLSNVILPCFSVFNEARFFLFRTTLASFYFYLHCLHFYIRVDSQYVMPCRELFEACREPVFSTFLPHILRFLVVKLLIFVSFNCFLLFFQ